MAPLRELVLGGAHEVVAVGVERDVRGGMRGHEQRGCAHKLSTALVAARRGGTAPRIGGCRNLTTAPLVVIAVLGRASRARSLEQQENSPDRHSFAAAAAARERKPLRELELSGTPKAVAVGVERDDSTACGGREQRGCACVSSTGLGGGEARLPRERAPPQPHHGHQESHRTRLAIIAVCTTGRSATSAAVERTATAV